MKLNCRQQVHYNLTPVTHINREQPKSDSSQWFSLATYGFPIRCRNLVTEILAVRNLVLMFSINQLRVFKAPLQEPPGDHRIVQVESGENCAIVHSLFSLYTIQ